jgi:hypothetical protein
MVRPRVGGDGPDAVSQARRRNYPHGAEEFVILILHSFHCECRSVGRPELRKLGAPAFRRSTKPHASNFAIIPVVGIGVGRHQHDLGHFVGLAADGHLKLVGHFRIFDQPCFRILTPLPDTD